MFKKLCAALFFVLILAPQVFAFEGPFLVLSSDSTAEVDLRAFMNWAEEKGLKADLLMDFDAPSDFAEAEAVEDLILKNRDLFQNAKTVLLWNNGVASFTALEQGSSPNQDILLITEEPFELFNGLAKSPLFLLHPKDLFGVLDGDLSGGEWVFPSDSWQNQLLSLPIPISFLALVLALPFLATFFVLLRKIFGISPLGLFLPTLWTVVFLVAGLPYGLLFFFAVLLFEALMRFFLKRTSFAGLSRSALRLFMLSIVLLFLLSLAPSFGVRDGLGFLFLAALVFSEFLESFETVYIPKKHGLRLWFFLELLIVSLLANLLLEWDLLKLLLLSRPELLLTVPVLLYLLNLWKGLYLSEYLIPRKK